MKDNTIPVNRILRENPIIHIVLVHPSIAPNVGNIARTCAGAHFRLHLIRPLGFELTDRYLKRAGLDYWPAVECFVHDHLEAFFENTSFHCTRWFTKQGRHVYSHVSYHRGDALIFGNEQTGIPGEWLKRYREQTVYIPRYPDVRSYNLSTAVGIAAFEAWRQITNNFRRPPIPEQESTDEP